MFVACGESCWNIMKRKNVWWQISGDYEIILQTLRYHKINWSNWTGIITFCEIKTRFNFLQMKTGWSRFNLNAKMRRKEPGNEVDHDMTAVQIGFHIAPVLLFMVLLFLTKGEVEYQTDRLPVFRSHSLLKLWRIDFINGKNVSILYLIYL